MLMYIIAPIAIGLAIGLCIAPFYFMWKEERALDKWDKEYEKRLNKIEEWNKHHLTHHF